MRYDGTMFMPICQTPPTHPGQKGAKVYTSSHCISSCLHVAKDTPALSRRRLPRACSRRVIFHRKVSRFPPTLKHVSPLNAGEMIRARSSRRW